MSPHPLNDRIRRRLREIERTPAEAARKGGLERNFFRDLLDGRKESVRESSLAKVAKGLDWTKDELLSGGVVVSDIVRSPDRSTLVPEIDVNAGAAYAGGFGEEENAPGAGNSTVSRDVIRAEWGIPVPFLRGELRLRTDRVHILPIRGDSMTDALYDGDRAVVALDDLDVSQGGIFAILDDVGSVIVKQVELIRSKKGGAQRILCTSRNPRYAPFELVLEDPVRIIGRVACRITRL